MTEKKKELTELQTRFLECLFSEETGGDIRLSMKLAGYSEGTAPNKVLQPLQKEIIQKAQEYLTANSSEAIFTLLLALRDGSSPGMANRIKAAESILNRGGVQAKDVVAKEASSGIVILPPKGSTVEIRLENEVAVDDDDEDEEESG